MKLEYIVKNSNYINIKQILKEEFNMSDRLILKLKHAQTIILNNKIANVNKTVKLGDKLDVIIDFVEDNSNIVPIKIDLNIIYEDDSMLVIDKPAKIPVHPSILHYDNSLANGVKFYFDEIGLKKKIRPVNRLDKDTSGIVIFAKNEYIQECLIKQMNNHTFVKHYVAIVDGILEKTKDTINAPIARKENSIIERCVNDNGDIAITDYYVIRDLTNMSFIHITLQTGRTHQIRVHMAYLKHPIIGDTLYGNASSLIDRQALHAYSVSFIHPITKKNMNFQLDLPNDIVEVLKNR